MLLQALREYAKRGEGGGSASALPSMYQETPIKWLIDLDKDGNLLEPGFITLVGDEGKKGDRGKRFAAPHAMKTVAIRAKLLVDNGEYVLGVAREKSKPARVKDCHEAFVEEIRKCARGTRVPSVQAVLRFLENLDLDRMKLPEGFDPSMNLSFRVDGKLPFQEPAVQEYWGNASTEGRGGDEMECLVCGQRKPAVKRHEVKIKGIPGGQVAGTALISANAGAFESYGLTESLIAPTCQECSEAFNNAANTLIQGENTRLYIGPLVYVFWTKEEREFSFASMLSDPDPGQVKTLLEAAWKARSGAIGLDPTPFYGMALGGSGGRVAVRDWIDTTVGEAQRHMARYFNLQRIVDWDGKEGPYLGIYYPLAASTVRDASKELPPNVPRALLRFALRGGELPSWLLFHAVKRNRAEQRVTRPRAALIKMTLLSQRDQSEEDNQMVQLDPANREPAYLCGRLLAALEHVQRAALGDVGATIVDRFYGAASSAPATVFGPLIKNAQAHLGKLRREKPGAHVTLQRTLQDVQEGLAQFPKTLTLHAQGLFALGYYHQRAKGWGSGKEEKE